MAYPDKRSSIILKAVVEEFIRTGYPVGSRTLSKKCNLSLSPATIRNTMADMEDAGLLEQTHVSSGRVPTDSGYRFYVDKLVKEFSLETEDLSSFHEIYCNFTGHLEHLIKRVTVILSNSSRLIGVVLAPKISKMAFRHIAFIKLSKDKILVVIVSKSGFVSNTVVSDRWNLSQDVLERMSNLINEKLADHYFFEYRKILLKIMIEEKNLYDQLISKAMEIGTMALKPLPDAEVFMEGQLHILSQPEFVDAEKIKNVFLAFEEKSKLISLLDKCSQAKGIQIFIGEENSFTEMKDYSLVASQYSFNEEAGVLGVIGPKRMEYSRVIPLVKGAANALNMGMGKIEN